MKQLVFLTLVAFSGLTTATDGSDVWSDQNYGAVNSTFKECIHGEYRCTDTSTDRCNHGVWVSNPCPAGTKCLGCGDWECVHEFDYDSLKQQLCVGDNEKCEKQNVHPYETFNNYQCEHGEFRCTDNSTDRCDHGVWVAFACPQGTKCLGCGDWECVLESDYDTLSEQLCAKKEYQHEEAVGEARMNQVSTIFYGILMIAGVIMF